MPAMQQPPLQDHVEVEVLAAEAAEEPHLLDVYSLRRIDGRFEQVARPLCFEFFTDFLSRFGCGMIRLRSRVGAFCMRWMTVTELS